eukprot:TRINITY_DN3166_c0_g1_i1.p1 TRINITY_DN3166_c0_g1~~TRINITY_DN3166_c0_g1_i1.p1  ORF type:complete len:321 (-),score=41.69 TRINITY_DN3166_c0_g1_i1:173-1135(-)
MFTYGLPLVGWNISYDITQEIMVLWVLLFYIGHSTKDFIRLPRPAIVNKKIQPLETHFSLEYGMPSTHVQAAISLPTFFLYLWFNKYGTFMSSNFFISSFAVIIYIALVTFSRIYLAVHSFFDVAFGAIFGILCLIFSMYWSETVWAFLRNGGVFYGIAILMLGIVFYPRPKHFSSTYRDTTAIIGVSVGILLGFEMSRNVPLFQANPNFPVLFSNTFYGVMKRSLVGIFVLVVCHESSKRIFWYVLSRLHSTFLSKHFPPQNANDSYDRKKEQRYSIVIPYKFLSYTVIGWINCTIVPFLFYRMGVCPNGWLEVVWWHK